MTVVSRRRTDQAAPSLGYGDYVRFSKLMENRLGLHFPESRRIDLERGVRQAFAASTCTDLDEYYRLLQDPTNGTVEMDRLVNALTVVETYFFRDAGQCDALYDHVLPRIIERRRPLRTLRIWSAGCASGEEPYSIAMLLRELLPDVDEWAITILGTDINTEALDRARKAVYGDWSFRQDRAKQWRSRYFCRQGKRYKLIPQVRRMVTFARLNLAEASYPALETNTTCKDLILCRNVTIYFHQSFVQEVVRRFYDALVDDGWLVVGHSEASLVTYRNFQVRNFPDAIIYQRTGEPTALPPDWEGLSSGACQPFSVLESAQVQPVLSTEADSGFHRHGIKDDDPFEQAQELLNYGHSEEAKDVLLKLVEVRPDHAPICALLGRAYANLGCWHEAERWCHRGVQLNSLALEAYYTLALVRQHQGKIKEAIDAMKKVIYIDRHHVLGHFGLADLYRSNGQLPQALKSLDNARRLLGTRPAEGLLPDSGGVTVDRLREAIVRQQQWWGIKREA